MTLVVQNDNGTAIANSYPTVAEFTTYFADRGVEADAYDTEEIEVALVKATDYADSHFQYIGTRRNRTQTTQWPRLNAIDDEGWELYGIPEIVKEAVMEYANIILSTGEELNPIPEKDETGQKVQAKKEKVGPLEEEVVYAEGASYSKPTYPVADQKLLMSGLVVTRRTLRRA